MLADKSKVWISEEAVEDVEHAAHDGYKGHLARLSGEHESLITSSHSATALLSPSSMITPPLNMAQSFKRDGSPARRAWLV